MDFEILDFGILGFWILHRIMGMFLVGDELMGFRGLNY
jgi:hypothetical protein